MSPAGAAAPRRQRPRYRGFLQLLIDSQSQTWFAKLVAGGELLVGVGLIVGAVVGVTAFATR